MESDESRKFYALSAVDASGRTVQFNEFRGHPLIIVNVATLCGLATSNYENLAGLLRKYHGKGLRILVFPCNQYLGQEPGTMEEIEQNAVCFSDMFVLFSKVDVFGKNIHPVFRHLTEHSSGLFGSFIKWNFTKFLVSRAGEVVKRISPRSVVGEDDRDLVECVEGDKQKK